MRIAVPRFSSPDPNVRWRTNVEGRLEFSTMGGREWLPAAVVTRKLRRDCTRARRPGSGTCYHHRVVTGPANLLAGRTWRRGPAFHRRQNVHPHRLSRARGFPRGSCSRRAAGDGRDRRWPYVRHRRRRGFVDPAVARLQDFGAAPFYVQKGACAHDCTTLDCGGGPCGRRRSDDRLTHARSAGVIAFLS